MNCERLKAYLYTIGKKISKQQIKTRAARTTDAPRANCHIGHSNVHTYIRTDKYTYIWTDDGRADKLICICRFAPKCKCSEEHKVLSKPTVISGVRTKQYCPFAPTNTRTSLPLFCLWRACLSNKKQLTNCCENNYCIPLIISF